ncbi:iron hydrogenase [Punctularia strigosozonata HHB-11173 SS5]|uniref:iron hydrogenase n=1 Tax=Punctularia strigosozonata (strain HHB-11173) TaxID=741275 RepID=UPI00044166F2|nr:iron hydrogenase [Punctularia strigosozonata HHB-11173 SS5]EIN11816.1 iron hydrogenase [Punctularia strigosozonata HHB-11173 SS5]
MAFSGALTLTDLNDFITPSQACIKPVEQSTPVPDAAEPGAASTQIHIDSSGSYYEVGSKKQPVRKLERAEITLNDCLACSGCITSAESVLITLQSHTEVMSFLENNPPPTSSSHKTPVLSIAPQSLASLAASISSSSSSPHVSLQAVLRRVQAFCGTLGFEHIYDTTFARHVALLEHAHEFSERKRSTGEGQLPMLASACPGWVCYAEKTHAEMLPFISRTKSPQQVMGTLVKEWLAKSWNKTPDMVYHVAVMPCYDKKLEASRQDFYNDVFKTRDVDCVITTGELELLMREKGWDLSAPVKGEAEGSRSAATEDQIPELLSHPGSSSGSYLHTLISAITRGSPAAASPGNVQLEGRREIGGTDSVPYASEVAVSGGRPTPPDGNDGGEYEVSSKIMRNTDFEEYTVTRRSTGEVMFRGARCYGFRNLQNVVRKVGRDAGVQVGRGAAGRLTGGVRGRRRGAVSAAGADGEKERPYDYVEVMACPGGCVNGGGQLRPPAPQPQFDAEGYKRDWEANGAKVDDGQLRTQGYAGKWGDKEWTRKVEETYWHALPTPPQSPTDGDGTSHSAVDGVSRKPTSTAEADRLAHRVLVDMCRPKTIIEGASLWEIRMDDEAEARRRDLFRTQYHAVENEVIGLAVKW